MMEESKNNRYRYHLTLNLPNLKSEFEKIKEQLITQYAPLGYTNKVIDKPYSLMLKNPNIEQSYIIAKYKEHDLSIETFHVDKPEIEMDKNGQLQIKLDSKVVEERRNEASCQHTKEPELNRNISLRDYDKEPIVIKDYNPLFLALYALSIVPFIVYIFIYNPGGTSERSLVLNVFAILPLMALPFVEGYLKARGKRKVVLDNETIVYKHDSYEIEKIHINEITKIARTYGDLYHSSQYEGALGSSLSIFFFPFVIHRHLMLIISKLGFHLWMNRRERLKIYDAIILFSEERVINILPISAQEYEAVESYFKNKLDIEIESLNIYFDYSHLPEKIQIGAKHD